MGHVALVNEQIRVVRRVEAKYLLAPSENLLRDKKVITPRFDHFGKTCPTTPNKKLNIEATW